MANIEKFRHLMAESFMPGQEIRAIAGPNTSWSYSPYVNPMLAVVTVVF